MRDIEKLETSKFSAASVVSVAIASLGTMFMAGTVFVITAVPPMLRLYVLLAVPGIAGRVLPYILYKKFLRERQMLIKPLIVDKYDKLYAICERGKQLL